MLRRSLLIRSKVVSDEGFAVVALVGAGEIRYTEGDRRVRLVACELVDGSVEFALPEGARWCGGDGDAPLGPAERERVVRNAGRALEHLGWRLSADAGGGAAR